MRKDGPYLRWACGSGRPGLANRPIGPVGPYFTIYTIYPLQLPPSPHLTVAVAQTVNWGDGQNRQTDWSVFNEVTDGHELNGDEESGR